MIKDIVNIVKGKALDITLAAKEKAADTKTYLQAVKATYRYMKAVKAKDKPESYLLTAKLREEAEKLMSEAKDGPQKNAVIAKIKAGVDFLLDRKEINLKQAGLILAVK